MVYFVILTCLLAIIYTILYNHMSEKKVVLLKIITSLSFLVSGFYAAIITKSFSNDYTKYILTALSFGFVGDGLLGVRRIFTNKRKVLFIAGMFSFLIGHIFNIFAFHIYQSKDFITYMLLSFSLTFIVIAIIQFSHLKTENTRGAMYLYMLVCGFVLSYSFFNMIDNYKDNFYFILLFVGSLSFVISDFLLSYIYFKKMRPFTFKVMRKINILTYFFAQTIFALSIYFMMK